MITKPVAWMSPDGKVSETEGKLFYIPLYTAPKPLSDEEIVSIWEKANYESQYYEASDNFAIEFARAIEERILNK